MIEFINFEKMFLKSKEIKVQIKEDNFELKIGASSHLLEYRILKIHEQIIKSRESTNLEEYLQIIDLSTNGDKEKMFLYIWENYKEKDLFTFLYETILEEIIIPYYNLMQDEKTIEYLKYGETKKIKHEEKKQEQEDQEKIFDEFFFELMQIKEPNISLYGATLLIHYKNREKAKQNIETVNQTFSCLLDLLEIYCRTDKDKVITNRVRDMIDDYKCVLGKNKPEYKIVRLMDLPNYVQEDKNGK